MCVLRKGFILSFKIIKIYPILFADEFTSSKNTQILPISLTTFCLYFVDHTHILFFLVISDLQKSLALVFNKIHITQT